MAHARDALWESGFDESVEVNQRALIDKVLARYSGEFTVFRELLQNSDDASATAVEIHFQTKEYLERLNNKVEDQTETAASPSEHELPDLKTAVVHQWTFKNNGIVFRDEDWSRLKKIAEGNPDEEKIGAFGVGFYSLFSVTEEPFVTSGGQWMGFYWKDKKDQLFARRGKLPDSAESPWTSFEMGLREPAPIPPPFDFTRFLASSITFMRHLLDVSVFLDDKRLSRLTKAPGAPKVASIPKGLKPSSPLNTMQVNGLQVTPLSIKAEVMKWVYSAGTEKPQPKKEPPQPAAGGGGGGFFSSLFSSLTASANPSRVATPAPPPTPPPKVDLTALVESNVMLSIFAADIAVKLDAKMIAELNRSTKKNPPTRMKYELIFTGKAEYDASKSEDEKHGASTGSVFQGLRADIDGMGQAKVFIGHATAQTTGIGGHMSARFIPTVERESIDLVDRNVAVWNKELLYVGGFLARSAYEIEMEHVQQLWQAASAATSPGAGIDPQLQASLRARAIHALKFFTFHPSTPSDLVSAALEEAFFSCTTTPRFSMLSSRKGFPIISTAGVRDAAEVRYPDPAFSGFVKDLAVVPEEVLKGAQLMVDALRARGMIKEITFSDVLKELRNRPLTEEEMVACFKWWIDLCNRRDAEDLAYGRTELLEAAVLSLEGKDGGVGQIIPLSVVESVLSRSGNSGALIPTDGPLPPHLLPVAISRNFNSQALQDVFGWRELTIVEWLKYLTSPPTPHDVKYDIEKSAPWAERVLQVLARAWPSMSQAQRGEVGTVLRARACVPTSMGLQKPAEAYFQSAHLFNDLPVVTLPSGAHVKGLLEKFLQDIGVRKHVNLQIIFDRMIKTGDWTIAQLIKYLVEVQSTLNAVELERLQMTSAFPRELRPNEKLPENGRPPRHRAEELYEPLDVLRELNLPVIDWGTHPKWRSNSEEAKFLFKLGLRRYPPLPDLIGLAASRDEKIRAAALKYLLDNFMTRYADYDPNAFSNVPFIPAVKGGTRCLARYHEVYHAPEWATLGLMVTDPWLKGEALVRLKIQEHPPGPRLVNLLQTSPPPTEEVGKQWFAALAGRVTSFSSTELRTLSQMNFVPVKGANGAIRHLPPTQCYFKGDSQAQVHSKLFTFVDFGPTANAFLSACGVKHEPSVEEVVKILLDNPRRFYDLAEGRENYLTELRNIAVNVRLVSSGTMARLKRAAVLLGSRRVRKGKPASDKKTGADAPVELEEEDWEYQWDLLTPDKVVIADDTNAYQLFGDVVFSAPQEDLLEAFYLELGCRRLGSLVREEYQNRNEVVGSRKAAETRALILERLPLFLHEHTHTQTKVSYTWLNNEKNFIVKTYGKLTVTKTLQFGDKRLSKSQDASAVARRIGRGPIELWLAGHDAVDMYEVSTSMCRLLFDAPKVNDALLFMTILSTDLRALRRRGYNVDRILRQQKADRQAAEDAAKAKQAATLASLGAANSSSDTLVSSMSRPDSTRPGSPLSHEKESHALPPIPAAGSSGRSGEQGKHSSRPMTIVRQSLDAVKRHLQKEGAGTSSDEDGSDKQLPLLPPRPSQPLPPQPHVTPRSNIASNIDLAVRACKGERGEVLKNRRQMRMVKESLNEGYCDISGHPSDMSHVGDMDGIKFFVTKDFPNGKELMRAKRDVLARFIYTIRPLQDVYTLPPSSLHIFYDSAGDTIAFNRNASLFLNLRYFEQWHDAEVAAGNRTNAYISWYFTLAHEIAHNLVQPHNSEHEFYFSSICEQYLPAFTKLIAGK